MNRAAGNSGFTLAEVMVAMAGTMIIVTALMLAAIGVQKSLRASEIYAASQADQRRLLDYLSRDMRRAVGIAKTANLSGTGAVKLTTQPLTVEGSTALVLTLPGYYQNNAPGTTLYDQPFPVTTVGERVDYGTKELVASNVTVTFRKEFVATENSLCFVRQEAGAWSVIARKAENLHLRITLAPDGQTADVEVWFESPFAIGVGPSIATYDQIMLRNMRID
jgi:Tfp pilus assembly protein PilV